MSGKGSAGTTIQSMTAFGRQEFSGEWGSLTWEIRSVNHRYLEPSFRLPDGFRELESALREVLRKRLQRGKVELNLRFQGSASGDRCAGSALPVDRLRVSQLLGAEATVAGLIPQGHPVQWLTMHQILSWPGVVEMPQADLSELHQRTLELFDRTLDAFIATRVREGEELKRGIEQRLRDMLQQLTIIKKRLPEILLKQRERLLNRLAEIQGNLDSDRLEQEMVYWAQKIDVHEELERLNTHIEEVSRVLRQGGAAGRRLDFLMQELNREANTIGSKSIDAETTQASVELKVLIEQMREQVQNIE